MIKENNGHHQTVNVTQLLKQHFFFTLFSSGLGTIGPHCITSPSVKCSWCWGTNILKINAALYRTDLGGGGVALLEITVHRQKNPEHLSIDSSDGLQV